MDTLEKLLAIEDIKNLKARYFRCVDTKQWAQWEKLFMPNIVAEFPDDTPGLVYRSARDFAGSIEQALGPALTLHHGHTPELEILTPTTARGIWVMQDWLHWPEGVNLPAGVRNIIGWGHYHETYSKTGDGWRIATLKLTRMKVDKFN